MSVAGGVEAGPSSERTVRLRTVEEWRRILEGTIGIPFTEGNRIEILTNGDEIFPAMLDAIEAAEHTVDLLTFVYWTGEVAQRFAETLAERAAAGVRVRVLLDAVGARLLPNELSQRMSDSGVDLRWFRRPSPLSPLASSHRTHRKVLVCDERVGFTGGVGIAAEWEGDARSPDEWRDHHFRVEGPAVDGLRAAFVTNWMETGEPLVDLTADRFPEQGQPGSSIVQVVRGRGGPGWNDMALCLRTLLCTSQERVRIVTPYFTPDEPVLHLLHEVADRGVRIEVMVPGTHLDKRVVDLAHGDVFDRLLDAGIELHRYEHTMLHAKVVLVDDVVSFVGSANVNSRSMTHDEEVAMVVLDADFHDRLDRHFDADLAHCEPVVEWMWDERSLWEKVAGRVSRIFQPFF